MLLHLSDLHFGTQKPECLLAIKEFCKTHTIEAIVVSGDLTQRAHLSEFHACKLFLESLNLPYLVVPGNHDIPLYQLWRRVFRPFKRYQSFFGHPESVLETAHFYIVGVNSIRRRHHTKGKLSLSQIKNIDDKLKKAPINKIKLVVVHQPFYVPSDAKHDIRDCPTLSITALKIWAKHGLWGLLHGHLHQNAVYDLNDIYKLNLNHPLYDIHAGTSTSYRLHHQQANSFNLITKDGKVSHYVFDSLSKTFK